MNACDFQQRTQGKFGRYLDTSSPLEYEDNPIKIGNGSSHSDTTNNHKRHFNFNSFLSLKLGFKLLRESFGHLHLSEVVSQKNPRYKWGDIALRVPARFLLYYLSTSETLTRCQLNQICSSPHFHIKNMLISACFFLLFGHLIYSQPLLIVSSWLRAGWTWVWAPLCQRINTADVN